MKHYFRLFLSKSFWTSFFRGWQPICQGIGGGGRAVLDGDIQLVTNRQDLTGKNAIASNNL